MNAEDYQHLVRVLSLAIEAAMWSSDFAEQVEDLTALQDVLEGPAKGLPLPEAARLRLEVLHVLKQADAYADDPRAKEFGTTFCLLETMTNEDRAKLATMLVQLLKFAAVKSETDG
jgi:hypothetical protein